MTKVITSNTELTTEKITSEACSRFEPIKEILGHLDEKATERAPLKGLLAA